jgi:hypothetical protein
MAEEGNATVLPPIRARVEDGARGVPSPPASPYHKSSMHRRAQDNGSPRFDNANARRGSPWSLPPIGSAIKSPLPRDDSSAALQDDERRRPRMARSDDQGQQQGAANATKMLAELSEKARVPIEHKLNQYAPSDLQHLCTRSAHTP